MAAHPTLPAAIGAILFNDREHILLVSPDGQARWQVIAGWLEQETIYNLKSFKRRSLGEV